MKIKKKQRKARFSYEVGKQKTISNPTAHLKPNCTCNCKPAAAIKHQEIGTRAGS